MQICWRNYAPLIAMFALIIASKALCAPFLPPGRPSAAAVLPHSDLSSEIRVTQNKPKRGRGWLGHLPHLGPRGLWRIPREGSLHHGWSGNNNLQGIVHEHVGLENTNLLPAPSSL